MGGPPTCMNEQPESSREKPQVNTTRLILARSFCLSTASPWNWLAEELGVNSVPKYTSTYTYTSCKPRGFSNRKTESQSYKSPESKDENKKRPPTLNRPMALVPLLYIHYKAQNAL
ncbi:hypothetical protein TWF696_001453 [Orbilia brochopaga]|uniref:Uncharacterized protein n=1 Tax=Orbilia brochopaga TaxID=3140254 RepID=A0AAV9U9H3_9PEZI